MYSYFSKGLTFKVPVLTALKLHKSLPTYQPCTWLTCQPQSEFTLQVWSRSSTAVWKLLPPMRSSWKIWQCSSASRGHRWSTMWSVVPGPRYLCQMWQKSRATVGWRLHPISPCAQVGQRCAPLVLPGPAHAAEEPRPSRGGRRALLLGFHAGEFRSSLMRGAGSQFSGTGACWHPTSGMPCGVSLKE